MRKTSFRDLTVLFALTALILGLFSPAITSVFAAVNEEVEQAPLSEMSLIREPVRHNATDQIFYFTMTDRFENGDPSNDRGGSDSNNVLVHGYLPTNKGYYHGGDLQGLYDRLDYIQGLGITAIWITPPFTNRWVQGNNTINGSSSGYHGYWNVDFTQIDPHFGTNDEMRALVDEAHSRGMKVFFDIITNHTGDVIAYQGGGTTYRTKAAYPYRDANGNIFDDRDYAGGSTFPELNTAISFPYVPVFRTPEDASVKVPAWLNNPIYYHNRGNSTFTGENSTYGDFVGLDDLFTEHPVVVQGMIDIHKDMITTFDIDGFRVDTVKHVNDEFWEAFVPAILDHAASLGKPDFFMYGEVYDSNQAYLSDFTTRLPWQSVLDFGFDSAAKSFAVSSSATNNLRTFFENDDYFTDDDSNAHFLVKFIGNHDMGRVGRNIVTTHSSRTDAEHVSRMKLITALMYFSRGAPVIYYGDEQGFTGDGGDQDSRQDMFPSQVASYNDDRLIGTSATTAASNFDTNHQLYQAFKELADVRGQHPALRQGAQIHRFSSSSSGIYAFSRIDRNEKIEYVIALNNSRNALTATVPTYSPSTVFTPIYPTGGSALTANASGNISVQVPGLGFTVYRAGSPISIPAGTPGISITTPAANATVTGRFAVTANVTGTTYAEVTFAVSVDGGEYQVLGTDDNPPYRVFYDSSKLPGGARLTFKAIVVDAKGAINSAEVNARTPVPHFGPIYALIHYNRPDGDYGSFDSTNFNDYWGLHLWGAIDEVVTWENPKRFFGQDDYGQFAWVRMSPGSQNINFIVHRGDEKDGTQDDRSFNPLYTPEIWLKAGDPNIYTSQAAAQRSVTIHYRRSDGNYSGVGLELWGDAVHPFEIADQSNMKPPSGTSDYGAFWRIDIVDPAKPVQFAIHKDGIRDPNANLSFIPNQQASAWIMSGRTTVYKQRGAAQNFAVLHYHRPAGDYGNYASTTSSNFWGLHTWGGASDPGWATPRKPVGSDTFGQTFQVPLNTNAESMGYIFHRGDTKDPGPDQFMVFGQHSYEIWQIQGADLTYPYIRSIQTPGAVNQLPVIHSVTGGGVIDEGGSVTIQVDASEPTSEPLVYQFDCLNDGIFEVGPQTGSTTSCTYGESGVYVAAVRVTDPKGGEVYGYAKIVVNEKAPVVNVSPETQQVQYSDGIAPIVIAASDVENDPMLMEVIGLPDGFSVTDPACAVSGGINNCTWTIYGQANLEMRKYDLILRVTDDELTTTEKYASFTIIPEDATVWFSPDNPVAVQVTNPGGKSGPVYLAFSIKETRPDLPPTLALPGDIALANASVKLIPMSSGSAINGVCEFSLAGYEYDGVKEYDCQFSNLPVDTYIVQVTVAGAYQGISEDILTVYDPSLGFTTGGGWFYWPGTDERVNFGYTMKYGKNGNNVKGNLLVIRHTSEGKNYRLKSNTLSGLALGRNPETSTGWASFSGRATYQDVQWEDAVGNHSFTVFVEDRSDGPDRFWIEVKNNSGEVIAQLSIPRDPQSQAIDLSGGNISVP